jgi:hypothetical protein
VYKNNNHLGMKQQLGFIALLGSLLAVVACNNPSPAKKEAMADSTKKDTAVQIASTEDKNLIPVYQAPRVWNGITFNAAGRTFVSFNGSDGPGMQLAEVLKDNTIKPYPDSAWNTTDTTQPLAHRFVQVNAVRFGPDGLLWVIDGGAAGIGKPLVPGGARLIVINTSTNKVQKVFTFTNTVKADSYVDDIRFKGPYVYITDAGHAGLIVLNQQTGEMIRRLNDHPSTTDQKPMYADGKITYDEKGRQRYTHADQLEVSPNGQWCYYMPCSGPLYRIPTRLLNNFKLPEDSVAKGVELFFDGPTTGGTAIAASGNIYYTDPNQRRVLKITPDGKMTVLLEDKRLLWPDAMWIDNQGYAWIPSTQQNLTPGFTGGKLEVKYPTWIYKYYIGEKPSPIDHQ